MAKHPPSTLDAFGATFLRVSRLVALAAEAQWQSGRSIQPAEDTTERSKGTTSDPTLSTVSDPRRMQLRASVVEAEHALTLAGRQLQAAERHLTDALEAHQNG